jgi:hypothetical protein
LNISTVHVHLRGDCKFEPQGKASGDLRHLVIATEKEYLGSFKITFSTLLINVESIDMSLAKSSIYSRPLTIIPDEQPLMKVTKITFPEKYTISGGPIIIVGDSDRHIEIAGAAIA